MKKIASIVMLFSIFGALVAGCSQPAAEGGDAEKPAESAGGTAGETK